MKPILFNTDMVRAILDNRKTVTRRVVKPQPTEQEENPQKVTSGNWYFDIPDRYFGGVRASVGPYRPPYSLGDILYVRETWCPFDSDHVINGVKYAYKADSTPESERVRKDFGYKWHPSIHMPREAARIFLRVTDVRVERLREITESEAEKEGLRYFDDICQDRDWHPTFCDPDSGGNPSTVAGFSRLWDSTIKPADRDLYGWEANPWVWAIEFERISRKEAFANG